METISRKMISHRCASTWACDGDGRLFFNKMNEWMDGWMDGWIHAVMIVATPQTLREHAATRPSSSLGARKRYVPAPRKQSLGQPEKSTGFGCKADQCSYGPASRSRSRAPWRSRTCCCEWMLRQRGRWTPSCRPRRQSKTEQRPPERNAVAASFFERHCAQSGEGSSCMRTQREVHHSLPPEA